jgi:hypothetical protein
VRTIAPLLAVLGLMVGVATQAVAFPLSISNQLALGNSVTYGVVRYFGFLTILTNVWLILIYFAEVSRAPSLSFLRKTSVQTSALATIMLVMQFNHFILSPTREPFVGVDILTDLGNHYVGPLIFLAFWLVRLPYASLTWRHLFPIMLPAVLYPAYVLIRGAIIDQYPYKVLDVTTKGYASVLAYMGVVIIGFAILCTLALGINALANLATRNSTQTA